MTARYPYSMEGRQGDEDKLFNLIFLQYVHCPKIRTLLKADRPHPQDYPHMPSDYRQTAKKHQHRQLYLAEL